VHEGIRSRPERGEALGGLGVLSFPRPCGNHPGALTLMFPMVGSSSSRGSKCGNNHLDSTWAFQAQGRVWAAVPLLRSVNNKEDPWIKGSTWPLPLRSQRQPAVVTTVPALQWPYNRYWHMSHYLGKPLRNDGVTVIRVAPK
jgi:hypothetical protein